MAKENMQKRVPKNDKKMNLSLNEEQREAKAVTYEKDITVLIGEAGSGKTLAAVQAALSMFYKKQINKIILIRAMVTAGEEWGFLPGDVKDKTDPFLAPIYSNITDLVGKEELEKLQKTGEIEVVPLGFARGRTFRNSFILVDEFQNMTDSNIKLILSRLGLGSKMVLTGDIAQIDLKDRRMSGAKKIIEFAVGCQSPYLGFYHLKQNHRHPVVKDILKLYEDVK